MVFMFIKPCHKPHPYGLMVDTSSIIPEGKHTRESRTFFGRTKLSYRLSLEPIHWDGDGSTPIISISRGIHIHKLSIFGYPGWVLTHSYIITATTYPWPCGYTARVRQRPEAADVYWPLGPIEGGSCAQSMWSPQDINCHDSGTDLLEVPAIYQVYIRPKFQGISPQKIQKMANNMVLTYLHSIGS